MKPTKALDDLYFLFLKQRDIKMKAIIGIIVGCLIGGLLGLLLASGESRYAKKSQQDTVFPTLSILGVVIGGIAGGLIGYSFGNTLEEEKKFGFDEIQTLKYQDGRKWIYKSTFTNPETKNTNVILTCYHKEADTVLTFFNNNSILNHETKSGAEKVIYKNHLEGRSFIQKKIRNGEISII
jgi:hypothetical protein